MNLPYNISHLSFLVVDDEPDNLEVVCDILSFYGATVESAMDGQEALKTMETFKPDLVITDLSMPVMDGWALLATMRKNPELARLPVVALTAHAMAGDKERGLAVGFSAYVTKPINAMTLISDLLSGVPSLTPAKNADKSTSAVAPEKPAGDTAAPRTETAAAAPMTGAPAVSISAPAGSSTVPPKNGAGVETSPAPGTTATPRNMAASENIAAKEI